MNRGGLAALHAALLLGAASGGAGAAAAPAVPSKALAFRPPAGPMLLSRTLRRDLADGEAVVTTRRYRVSFTPTASGWHVDGELLGCDVTAPPALAMLAEIERKRTDAGLFPLELDREGLILPTAPSPQGVAQGRESVDQAVSAVLGRVHAQPSTSAVGAPIAGFLRQIQALAGQAALTRWPATLFLPASESREERRFELPEGGEGTVTAKVNNAPAPGLATMGHATRVVVTRVGADSRTSREDWSLEPLAGASG